MEEWKIQCFISRWQSKKLRNKIKYLRETRGKKKRMRCKVFVSKKPEVKSPRLQKLLFWDESVVIKVIKAHLTSHLLCAYIWEKHSFRYMSFALDIPVLGDLLPSH